MTTPLILDIQALSDANAEALLKEFAANAPMEGVRELSSEQTASLAQTFGVAEAAPERGELAKSALTVLALHPRYAQPLQDRLDREAPFGPSTEPVRRTLDLNFGQKLTLIVITLLVLQTSFRITNDTPDGRITWEVEHIGLEGDELAHLIEAGEKLAKEINKIFKLER